MTQYAIVTDLNRCVACMACNASCKMVNNVPIGQFWNKVLRIGPNEATDEFGQPSRDFYYLPVQCQHCYKPECVAVCPTGASQKMPNGTVQIDKEKCIGCQFCVMACPYGVRYLNEEEGVVEKCTLCEQKTEHGELPQCVINCGGHARFFGDLEKGIETFVSINGATNVFQGKSYEEMMADRVTTKAYLRPWGANEVYTLPDVGNGPSLRYILRGKKWQG